MSTCISRHGEYSEHETREDFYCTRCWELDEAALVADRDQWRDKARGYMQTLADLTIGINDQLAPEIQRQKADAWDEGFEAGQRSSRGRLPARRHPDNPYRRQA